MMLDMLAAIARKDYDDRLHAHIIHSAVAEVPGKSADAQVCSRECALRQCWSMSLLPRMGATLSFK